jgi:phospholipid-translocating ATPase
VLYNQFKFFFNMFFLFTALSQLIEYLRVGLFITYIGPLIMVLSLTMAKEAYDDYRTYLRDIEANSKIYTVIEENGNREVKSKDLRVGDVVVINAGDRIPADMLTLYSDD